MKSKGASISLSLDDLLTEEGTELTIKATDSTGTKEETLLIPWTEDDEPPEEPKSQG